MKKHILIFPEYITEKLKDIQVILDNISQLSTVYNDRITLDFSKSRFIASELSPLIDSIIYYFESHNNEVIVHTQSLKFKVKQALSRNRFLEKHNLELTHSPDDYQTAISYTNFSLNKSSEDWSKYISEYLKREVFENIYWPKENSKIAMSKIKESIVEIVDNIFTHSHSEKVFLCGQYYPQKHKLNFTILDTGDGIPDVVSMVAENRDKSDSEKIDWAMREGTTTINEMSSKTTRGIGLSTIYEELLGYGELTILSSKGYWKLTSGTSIIEPTKILKNLNFGMPGTLIHISFFTEKMSSIDVTHNKRVIDNIFEDIF